MKKIKFNEKIYKSYSYSDLIQTGLKTPGARIEYNLPILFSLNEYTFVKDCMSRFYVTTKDQYFLITQSDIVLFDESNQMEVINQSEFNLNHKII